jgi:hypothetical protein
MAASLPALSACQPQSLHFQLLSEDPVNYFLPKIMEILSTKATER